MTNERLKEIYQKFDLKNDDIYLLPFGSVKKPIITRTGIEKIQSKLNIEVNYKVEKISDDLKHCVVLANAALMEVKDVQQKDGSMAKRKVPMLLSQSFGESAPYNNKNAYPVAMAEKRALSRVVIKLAGLAEDGLYGEDEAEDFKKK